MNPRGLEPHGKMKEIGFRLSEGWKNSFSIIVAISVPRSAEELGVMLHGGSRHGFILYV